MLRIILVGCHGRMGKQTVAHCKTRSDVRIIAGLDRTGQKSEEFPVLQTLAECHYAADVLIDFSVPDLLETILVFCTRRGMPLVLAATGYSPYQTEQIRLASHCIPIFRAANLSIGANLLLRITELAATALGPEFGAAITERHHSKKTDSPSGTALLLAKSIPQNTELFSIRAGTTAGEHTVIFAGPDEVLELSHRADSREVYATGAIRAAHYISQVKHPGLYGMDDLLN